MVQVRWWICSVLACWGKKSSFNLCFWKVLCWVWYCRSRILFFKYIKRYCSILFSHALWQEVSCQPYLSSPLCKMSFFFLLLLKLLFIPYFEQFDYDTSWCIFMLPILGFPLNFLNLWVCSFHKFCKLFSHLFLPNIQNIFLNTSCTFSSRDSSCTFIRLLERVPPLTDALLIFLEFFSPMCFILDSFYCCVFRFTNLFIYNI